MAACSCDRSSMPATRCKRSTRERWTATETATCSGSGAKSDARDALVLAKLVRTDRQDHRRVAGDSDDVEGLKMVTRSHQNLIWARTGHILQLRAVLLEYYPAMVAAGEGARSAVATSSPCSRPSGRRQAHQVSDRHRPRRAGRRRNVAAVAERIQTALRVSAHLQAAECFGSGCAHVVKALVAVIGALNDQIDVLHTELKVRPRRAPRRGHHRQAAGARPGPGSSSACRVRR